MCCSTCIEGLRDENNLYTLRRTDFQCDGEPKYQIIAAKQVNTMSKMVPWTSFQETVASQLGLPIEKISKTTHVYDNLGLDSLGLLSLGMKLHAVFKIRVPLSAITQIYTVGDIFRVMGEYAEE